MQASNEKDLISPLYIKQNFYNWYRCRNRYLTVKKLIMNKQSEIILNRPTKEITLIELKKYIQRMIVLTRQIDKIHNSELNNSPNVVSKSHSKARCNLSRSNKVAINDHAFREYNEKLDIIKEVVNNL